MSLSLSLHMSRVSELSKVSMRMQRHAYCPPCISSIDRVSALSKRLSLSHERHASLLSLSRDMYLPTFSHVLQVIALQKN